MPQSANEKIKEALWALLQEKPLNKITVKDIVTKCDINRNTFYYHFESIPALSEELIEEMLDKTIKKYPNIYSFEECVNVAIEFILKNKKAVNHIYNSADRASFESYLLEICHYAVFTYLNRKLKDSNIDSKTKQYIIEYYKCEIFGQVIAWLQGGLKDVEDSKFKAFCKINTLLMDSILEKLNNKPL